LFSKIGADPILLKISSAFGAPALLNPAEGGEGFLKNRHLPIFQK